MSTKFVVGLSCTAVQKAPEKEKRLIYFFQVTWSDESTSSKEVSSESLAVFRHQLKTEVYKNKPEVTIPEVPDGKVGGFASKAKKMEKRKKAVDEFCTQIINLPHVQGKLQAIASQFESLHPAEPVPNITSNTAEVESHQTETAGNHRASSPGHRDEPKMAPGSAQPEPESGESTPEGAYAEVIPDARFALKRQDAKSYSKLQYVEIEIIAKEKRSTRDAASPVYAEVVLLKSSAHSDWLNRAADPDDPDDPDDDPDEVDRCPPTIPPRISASPSDEDSLPAPPDLTEIHDKAEVHAPEAADEMSDSAEHTLVRATNLDSDPGKKLTGVIFDAAMMSNFPSRTLIPLPPSHSPKKCPASSDLKLSKSEEPCADVPNVCIVAVCGCRSSGDNTLSFKRKQQAHLLYTTDAWWFVRTRNNVGWVPADYWRIVTDSKIVSGKAMAGFAPWNFGVLGRADCDALLKTGNQMDFLVRERAHTTGCLVLSVKKDETVRHFGIQVAETGFCYIGRHHFQTIHNVVLYYMRHSLFTDSNGKGCLLGRLFVRPKD